MIDIEDIRSSQIVRAQLGHSLSQDMIDGMYLEFGVFKGWSINVIAKRIYPKLVHGFDSFEGLPEEWIRSSTQTYRPGHFDLCGQLPVVDENVRLHKGWFSNTLLVFLEGNDKNVAFLNIDSDIYSSAIYILTTLNDFIVPGTIIRFDEISDWGLGIYSEWKDHEYRALNEWLDDFERVVEPISRDDRYSATVRVRE